VPGSEVTAIPSGTTHLDLFISAADGTVQSTWWEQAPGWHSWFAIGAAANAPAGETVLALRNGPNHLDLFITASDGSIKSTWWEPAPNWHSWFSIGPAGVGVAGGAIAGAWNGTTRMDLFLTASDGTIKTTWWQATPGWQPWTAVGATGSAPPQQPITALWTLPGQAADIGGNYIHAIDITTGLERPFSPVKIQAAAPSNPATILDPRCHRNRPGLLLSGGTVYAGFSCLTCDRWCSSTQPFSGWVVGYNASNLQQTAVFNTATMGSAAGVWQSGSGLAADAAGNIYFQTGNGEPANAAKAPPLGDSVVKLTPSATPPGLVLGGSYQPANAQALRCGDTDLGAGGPALLPNGMLIGGGKEGKFYLINTATMAANQQFQAFANTWHADPTQPPCAGPSPPWITCTPPFPGNPPGSQSTASCYVDPSRYQQWQNFGPNIHGSPVVWPLPKQGYALIYKMPEKDYVKAYKFDLTSLQVATSPFLTATIRPPDGMPGGFSSLSANGEQGGILWTLFSAAGDGTAQPVPSRLVAFDATTLASIWEDDGQYLFAKFNPPTIADGKVFRPTYSNKIVVYGILPAASTGATEAVAAAAIATPKVTAPSSCLSLDQAYQNLGGAKGILGTPVGGPVTLDSSGAKYQNFRGQSLGGSFSMVSKPMTGMTVQDEDEDMPAFLPRINIEASIYWSPASCAHVVLGDIRKLWVSLGAQKSSLGFPTSDEIPTPDERGRRNRFQHGEIWWYPERGAFVNAAPHQ
jgi:hypothetical protein